MTAWMNTYTANMACLLSEDVGAPELRNPRISGIRRRGGLLSRLIKRSR